MAYNNPFSYNRDSSVDSKYKYVADLSKFKPIYGSSVSFSSRLNYLQTVDNTLKILPASENNLVVKYNLKFLLTDDDLGSLLKTIEIAGAYRYLKFTDPSNFYKDIIGLVEDYATNKSSQNLNELNIIVSSYFKSPIFNWRTSSFFNIDSSYDYSSSKNYSKYDFVYYDDETTKNKIDNFWFANTDIVASNSSNSVPSANYWNKKFIFEPKLPFELKNKFDFYQSDYKNSFIQNIKHKENSNTLKQYSLKFENISDKQCLSILLYLEKKCGYRRFIYDFPFLLKKGKVFICTEWDHVLKYSDCNDVTATFIEDPNPDMSQFSIEGEYDDLTYTSNLYIGFVNGLLYKNDSLFSGKYSVENLFYLKGVLRNGASPSAYSEYYINGIKKGPGIQTYQATGASAISGKAYDEAGNDFISSYSGGLALFNSTNQFFLKYHGLYMNGSVYNETVTDGTITLIYHNKLLYKNETTTKTLYSGLFNNLFYVSGTLADAVKSGSLKYSYSSGYPNSPLPEDLKDTSGTKPYLYLQKLYIGNAISTGYRLFNNIDALPRYTGNGLLYFNGLQYTGIWKLIDGGNDKAYFSGRLFTGIMTNPKKESTPGSGDQTFYYENGEKLVGSDIGVDKNGYFYQYGYKIISTGYYNGKYYLNGVEQ